MANYIQGEPATLFASYYNSDSQPISVGISGVNVSVYHFDTGVLTFDLLSGSMTQQSSPFDNVWYYNYTVANNALVTTYNVIYNSLFSGNTIQFSETFDVLPAASSFPNPYGQGNVHASGTVTTPSGVGIVNVSVVVSSGLNTFAATTTNVSGLYNVYLNPGNYLFSFYADGYFNTQSLYSIPSGTMWNLGQQIMQPDNAGSVVISDQFMYQTPNGVNYYLPNLKVTLNNKLDSAEAEPTAISYTNVSGTFFANADPGLYVMTVQGEFWNVSTNKNDRYNYIYNIEVNPVWSGTGASGNSTPYNFVYLDSSKYNYL